MSQSMEKGELICKSEYGKNFIDRNKSTIENSFHKLSFLKTRFSLEEGSVSQVFEE